MAEQGLTAEQQQVERLQTVDGSGAGGLGLRPPEGALGATDRVDDASGQLVLNHEEVGERPVVALGPDLAAGSGVDQAHGRPQPTAVTVETAFEHVPDAELSTNLARIVRLVSVGKAGAATDDEHARLGQRADDVANHAVGQPSDTLLAGTILEWQDSDRRLVGERRARRAGRRPTAIPRQRGQQQAQRDAAASARQPSAARSVRAALPSSRTR